MFQVNRSDNRLVRLEERRFADLGLREREHLQEWLVRMPDALGEDLLIVQKEFDGFADTRERLDILALDKVGRLVVIENKLDDSGRDVVWQALKYVAYCSNLKKAEIVEIYQKYLDRWFDGTDAVTKLCVGRPQSSWTRIKGESDVTRRWGYGSVEAGEGSWVGADGGSPEGDRSRRRRGGDGVGGLGAGTTVEREPETGCGVAAAA